MRLRLRFPTSLEAHLILLAPLVVGLAFAQPEPVRSTLCRFTAGPRAGETRDYAPLAPLPVGAPCQDGAGSIGYIVARVKSAPPTAGDSPVQARSLTLTGREFLLKPLREDSGYGLYSYLLFGTPPNDITRPRYLSAIEAYFQSLPLVEQYESQNVQRAKLNITYMPLQKSPPRSIPDGGWIIANYDYARAQLILSNLPGGLRVEGPYLVSSLRPLSSPTQAPDKFLYQNLSSIPPSLMLAWFREFMVQAAQKQFWEEPVLTALALNLRTSIELAAIALPDVRKATGEWRSIMTAAITVQGPRTTGSTVAAPQ